MNKNYSILGCGWLGKPLGEYFIKQGISIKGSTTTKSKLQDLSTVGIEPYLIDLEVLQNNISEFLNSEVLIVAITSKNIQGFKNLIKEIENSSIKKVLFISSTSVYLNLNKVVAEEDDTIQSDLAFIEQLFLKNKNFQTTIVRFAGLFGYDRKPGNFFKSGKIIPNPEGFVNMIHRDDCISIISEIINKEIWGEILNACADSHPTRREFYTKTSLDIGNILPAFEKSKKTEFKIISNDKLKKMLDFEFKYPNLLNIDYETFDNLN